MTDATFDERDIHLALDGELPAEQREDFEAWLEAHPEMKVRSQRYEADRARLRAAVEALGAEPVPARLTQLVTRKGAMPAAGQGRWWTWRYAAAAAAAMILLLAGGLAGFGIGQWTAPAGYDEEAALVDGAIAAHKIYAAEQRHVVEVGAEEKDHLQSWLSKRVGVPLVAPDLRDHGFELVGGRLLPGSQERSAAQFMYQDKDGNRVSVYVLQEAKHAGSEYGIVEEGGTYSYYWLDQGYGCAVTGTIPEPVLTALAKSAYAQLLESGKKS